ncbi:MAG: TonB family protein [Sulfuriferula multivorans]|uniref:Protein TonB n=1 Tax=Sulfuriferula multivorans TaxID=1559896 RepID=A0A7C9P927_9PROT|nr:TonB family protein [Sulfuriferula multivorans]
MTSSLEEPSIPARVQRPLAAIWISLGLHVAVIALVQVAPPGAVVSNAPVIEARLVSTPHKVSITPSTVASAETQPVLVPSDQAEALPIETPQAVPQATVPTEAPPAKAVAVEPDAEPAAPALAITSAVDLTFYSARDVDVHPQALADIAPSYPQEADSLKLSGKVIVQLKLEADGSVMDVEVVKATPPDVFEKMTVEAFREARFSPALKDGHPVRSLMLIEMTFNWAGRTR